MKDKLKFKEEDLVIWITEYYGIVLGKVTQIFFIDNTDKEPYKIENLQSGFVEGWARESDLSPMTDAEVAKLIYW